ncbi:hypothetical protein B0J12DRAFT_695393 [Macrophomina phaseolina]|uniref:Uncharacterized protein n=1 Tax=Macrophomina phaseolina TaxID=35725 RepID=A0ABQ8GN73_9PEZI|nr:hypothetical protein B0J12DRAFT_695393 [Macrophomina phaseolina]
MPVWVLCNDFAFLAVLPPSPPSRCWSIGEPGAVAGRVWAWAAVVVESNNIRFLPANVEQDAQKLGEHCQQRHGGIARLRFPAPQAVLGLDSAKRVLVASESRAAMLGRSWAPW